jgi:hypothetical protein
MNHPQLNYLIAQQHVDGLRHAADRERLAQSSHADRRTIRVPWPTIAAPFGRSRSSRRRRLLGCLAAAALGVLGVSVTPALAASSTFYYLSNYQYFTVPSGVSAVHFDVIGGSGANGQGSYGAGSGGSGAQVTGDISISPGSVLTIWAGGAGQPGGGDGYGNPSHDDFDGGSGGSGYGITTGNGGGGGAASYVRLPSGGIIALAGGGGGGAGGGTAGTSAGNGSDGAYLTGTQDVNGWDADAASGGNGGGGARGGNPNVTLHDNGADGGSGGDGLLFGGGGGGGGGGYLTCGRSCYAAGGGGQGGVGSGGGGGAGGNSYAEFSATGVSFNSSTSSPGTAGQITLSYRYDSTIQVTSSSVTSGPGQSVTFEADVDPSDGGGTVTLTSDGTVIPGCSDLSFAAGGGAEWLTSCSTSSLPSGTHTITATYSGDGNFAGSSGAITETVLPKTTSTSLSSSANPSLSGRAVTYTATVSPAPDDGTVAFSDAGSSIPGCTAQPLTSHGAATCQVTYTAAGSHAIQAEYSGDPSFASGTSPRLTQQVQASTSTSPPQGPPNPQGPTPPQGPSSAQSAPQGPQGGPQSPSGPHGHPGQIVCRNTGPATTTCLLVLKPGIWPSNRTATIANYRITRGGRTVARGTVAIRQGRLVFRSRRLRPGRYELTLTFRRGQHQTIRVRRYFSVQ